MKPQYDDEETKDSILEHLQGEVDDFAGEQLPDDEKPEGKPASGVEISIIVKPKGAEGEEVAEGEPEDEHDDIAHALGMHDGGCTY